MKQKILIFTFLFILVCIITHPATALLYAKAGLLLWFQTLIPSLLPFMIISNVLIQLSAFQYIPSWLSHIFHLLFGLSQNGIHALLLGWLCGYPMGVKITADLYRQNKLNRQEASYLMTFTNCASPAFLSSFLLEETLHAPNLACKSICICYLSTYITSFVFRHIYHPDHGSIHQNHIPNTQISGTNLSIDTAIMNSFETITRIGGYIILFSIGNGFLKELLPDWKLGKCILLCITEITTGITITANSGGSFIFCYITALCATSFGGLCITGQSLSMLHDTDLSIKPYLIARICNTLITLGLLLLFV